MISAVGLFPGDFFQLVDPGHAVSCCMPKQLACSAADGKIRMLLFSVEQVNAAFPGKSGPEGI
jgi:hypothetical protein